MMIAPDAVLDGINMRDDLDKLVSFMWSVGITETDFPSNYCAGMVDYFMLKHGKETRNYRLGQMVIKQALKEKASGL